MLRNVVITKKWRFHENSLCVKQSWKVIEKLKILSEKRNDFWKRKVKSKSEKKIEKLKAKSKSFIYITFFNHFFPSFHSCIAWTIQKFLFEFYSILQKFCGKSEKWKNFWMLKANSKSGKNEKLKAKSNIFNFENCKWKAKVEVLWFCFPTLV